MTLTLRARLYIVCIGLIVVLAAPALYGLGKLAELRDIAFDLRIRHATAFLATGRLQSAVAELNRLERSYLVAPGPEVRREMFEAIEMGRAQLDDLERSGYGEAADPAVRTFEALERGAWRVDGYLRENRVAEATSAFRAERPQFDRFQEALSEVAGEIERRSTGAAIRAQEIAAQAARTTTLGLLGALFVALVAGMTSVQALTSPLRRLREATAAVADGEFHTPADLPYGRTDEIGDLSRSFRAMTSRLAELDRLKAEFVSMASHELKTPVSVIRGYAEMMEDGFYGEVSPKQRRVLGYMEEQTATLADRIDQLLALSRFEAKGFELVPVRVALGDFVEGLRRTFRSLASQREVDFRIRIEPSAPRLVRMDPERIRNEVLGNLLSNAFKFTPSGGSISVAATGEGGRGGTPRKVVFEVSDTGEGIPPAQLPFVFEKYYQAGPHAGKVGAGLGLAIVREVVRGHGGEVAVTSEPGRGTTFRVVLPARGPVSEGADPASDSPDASVSLDVREGGPEATLSRRDSDRTAVTGTGP